MSLSEVKINGVHHNDVHSNGVHSNGVKKDTEEHDVKVGCLQRFSNRITGGLEEGFARLGLKIGLHPWRFILGCSIVVALCGLGLIAFKEVTDPDKLWVPEDAQVVADKDWIEANYPSNIYTEQLIAVGEGDNILTPTGIVALWELCDNISTVATSSGITLDDVCIKAGSNCLVYGILELWSFDEATIRGLSSSDILNDVNTITVSPMYGREIDITRYLGDRTTDGSGQIVSASAAYVFWLTQGSDEMKDTTQAWETKFIDVARSGHSDLKSSYVFAVRSFSDVGGDAISGDVTLLSIGYFLVIIFVIAVLGKFNFMEQRVYLAGAGFLCVGMSILVSIGLSSAFQQEYGPVQSVLPFLLLGLGVDDMFVIMGALNNLRPEEKALDIPQRVSAVLKHAGVSITVTSFTDFVAFMIGATTIIPALRSFCIYAGIGIASLYILQAMFFTACMTLDLRRMEAGRDACCCCCVKRPLPYQPSACSQKQFIPFVFKKWLAKAVIMLPVKIIVIFVAVVMFGVNMWGLVELEQYFDPNWFLPGDSYAFAFTQARDRYFPDTGATGYVYCGNINYWSHQTEFESLDTAMSSSQWFQNGTTDSWFTALTSWLDSTADASVTASLDGNKYPVDEAAFIDLTYKMTTQIQTRTASYILFDNSSINTANADIEASRFPFTHISMDKASTQIDAMDSTRALVSSAGFSSSECFAYSRFYLTWETNKVIREELFRNLGLALACVFIVTLILIANLWTSLIVFLGVVFTLVDVAGSMHFWGLTIDTVTSIILVLSIGLAVDYSAHIGHKFMTIVGDRHARIKETVGEMGAPVFYGGFSTFLAFVLLSQSTSYVFTTFFKVNFLVCVYGLFHGLIFLPVVLSWLGPDPYPTAGRDVTQTNSNGQVNQGYMNDGQSNGIGLPPLRNIPPSGHFSQTTETHLGSQSISPSPPPSYESPKPSPPPDYSTHDKRFMPSVNT